MSDSAQTGCEISFADPTDDLLQNARELMFRTAVVVANSNNIQHVRAIQDATMAVYSSSSLNLGLASLATVLAILLVAPTFYEYSHVGRTVFMSPIEIAKAFDAPLLRNEDSNAKADDLIKEVGHRRIRYGLVAADYDDGQRGSILTVYREEFSNGAAR